MSFYYPCLRKYLRIPLWRFNRLFCKDMNFSEQFQTVALGLFHIWWWESKIKWFFCFMFSISIKLFLWLWKVVFFLSFQKITNKKKCDGVCILICCRSKEFRRFSGNFLEFLEQFTNGATADDCFWVF